VPATDDAGSYSSVGTWSPIFTQIKPTAYITGVRFYKERRQHRHALSATCGVTPARMLASAYFYITNETFVGDGRQANFPNPVAVTCSEHIICSVLSDECWGISVWTMGYFTASGVNNIPLCMASADTSGYANDLYGPSPGKPRLFPTKYSETHRNYWGGCGLQLHTARDRRHSQRSRRPLFQTERRALRITRVLYRLPSGGATPYQWALIFGRLAFWD